jgi:hypothetical protein
MAHPEIQPETMRERMITVVEVPFLVGRDGAASHAFGEPAFDELGPFFAGSFVLQAVSGGVGVSAAGRFGSGGAPGWGGLPVGGPSVVAHGWRSFVVQLGFWASNTMGSCPCYLRLRASLTMPLMTGKTNVHPVDDPAVTDRDKH